MSDKGKTKDSTGTNLASEELPGTDPASGGATSSEVEGGSPGFDLKAMRRDPRPTQPGSFSEKVSKSSTPELLTRRPKTHSHMDLPEPAPRYQGQRGKQRKPLKQSNEHLIRRGTQDFAALQKQWYDHLATEGFEDIEWVDHRTGKGQNSDFLKGASYIAAKAYNSATEEHYRLCGLYLNHGGFETKFHRRVFELYTQGTTYREMVRKIYAERALWNRSYSIFWYHTHVHQIIAHMRIWVAEDPSGFFQGSSGSLYLEDLEEQD